MTSSNVNRIASIRQRLLDRAKSRGEDFQLVLDRFAIERLLYRLSLSAYFDQFLLKGAMLFALWFEQPHRPTRDADFLGFGTPDPDRISKIIQELCSIESDDGIQFDETTLTIEAIREQAKYNGLRITMLAMLGNARCNIQWDIGFGDAVTPRPIQIEYPSLLDDLPSPQLLVYPRETVFAEKYEALVQLGIANSRMKDYFDLLALTREAAMNPEHLANAIQATFERRKTAKPESQAFGLSDEFANDKQKQIQWHAFLNKNRLQAPSLDLVVTEIRDFISTLKAE